MSPGVRHAGERTFDAHTRGGGTPEPIPKTQPNRKSGIHIPTDPRTDTKRTIHSRPQPGTHTTTRADTAVQRAAQPRTDRRFHRTIHTRPQPRVHSPRETSADTGSGIDCAVQHTCESLAHTGADTQRAIETYTSICHGTESGVGCTDNAAAEARPHIRCRTECTTGTCPQPRRGVHRATE
ncbi:hypothetical protein, partial [Nocardia arizonensis]|uniref:hypothetical protein n=1 Tax=Nocardia arizonensis TaxID=1141647 RepID=UPI0012E1372E